MNGDGKVDKEDLSLIVNVIMGNVQEGFDVTQADVNGDGAVNAADIVAAINDAERVNTPNNLVLLAKGGKRYTYALADNPTVSFSGSNLIIASKGSQKEYPMKNIFRITYEKISGHATGDAEDMNMDSPNGAEHAGNVFYVYRNDGDFNGFFYDQVESIAYSNVGIDGKQRPYQVVQEISTADSLYRIPLVAVDSLGFIQPQAIMNSSVFTFTSDHSSYILQADTETFTLKKSTPAEFQPQIGNVVVSSYDCLSFPDGIMAKVVNRTEQSDGIHYVCEHASIDDVYDQIVYYGYGDEYDPQLVDKARTRAEGRFGGILWDRSVSGTLNYGGTTSTLTNNTRGALEILMKKTLGSPMYVRLTFGNEMSSEFSFNAKSEVDLKPEPVKIGKTIVAGRIVIPEFPVIWFEPQMSLYGYFEEEGSVDLDFAGHFRRLDKFQLTCNNKKWTFTHTTPVNDSGIDVASLSMKGYAEVGLQPELMISMNGFPTGIGISTKFGLRETVDFKFDALSYLDEGFYSSIKDSKTEESITLSGSIFAQLGIFEDDCMRGDYQIGFRKIPFSTHYLLPTFNGMSSSRSKENLNNYVVTSSIGRDLLLPMNIGYGLFDENDELIQTKYSSLSYRLGKEWTLNGLVQTFDGITPGKKYTCSPMVKILGVEIRATPSIELENDLRVKTGEVYNVGTTSAVAYGQIISEDLSSISQCEYGICYTEKGNSSSRNYIPSKMDETGSFTVTLSNLKPKTEYSYCAYLDNGNDFIFGDLKSFETTEKKEDEEENDNRNEDDITYYNICPDDNHPHWIDLGLPSGTLWRCCNEGASTPEAYGGYYNFEEMYISAPSWGQILELLDNTTSEWTTQNGVNGRRFTGSNGGTIFLPAAGYFYNGVFYEVETDGRYWSSTPHALWAYPYDLRFNSGQVYSYKDLRYAGQSVRPVRK